MAAGAPLFVLADTTALWVSAEIHERDWTALDVAPGSRDCDPRSGSGRPRNWRPKCRHVGGQVSAETRSVPLVAELPNPDGRLKPGLFAWALVPLDKPREALVVPASAIVRNENQPFVFVPAGERTFAASMSRSAWKQATCGSRVRAEGRRHRRRSRGVLPEIGAAAGARRIVRRDDRNGRYPVPSTKYRVRLQCFSPHRCLVP